MTTPMAGLQQKKKKKSRARKPQTKILITTLTFGVSPKTQHVFFEHPNAENRKNQFDTSSIFNKDGKLIKSGIRHGGILSSE